MHLSRDMGAGGSRVQSPGKGVAQSVEGLPSMHEASGSCPSTSLTTFCGTHLESKHSSTQHSTSSSPPGFAGSQSPKLPGKPHLYSIGAALEAAVGIEEDTPAVSWGGRSSGGGYSLEGTGSRALLEAKQRKGAKYNTEPWGNCNQDKR